MLLFPRALTNCSQVWCYRERDEYSELKCRHHALKTDWSRSPLRPSGHSGSPARRRPRSPARHHSRSPATFTREQRECDHHTHKTELGIGRCEFCNSPRRYEVIRCDRCKAVMCRKCGHKFAPLHKNSRKHGKRP